jgi:hypothetical protein
MESEIIVFDVKQDRNSVVIRLQHQGDIRALNLAQNGFFSGVERGVIQKWNVKNIFDIKLDKTTVNEFFCSEFDKGFDVSDDGKHIFGVSNEHTSKIIIEDTERGKTLVELEGHESVILCIRHSQKYNKLYSGSNDKTIIKWDLHTYRKEKVFSNFHSSDIQSLLLVSEERLLVSGSKDKFLNLFETKTGSHVGTVKFDTSVFCLEKDHTQTRIISGGKDTQDLRIWDISSILKFCQQQVSSLRKINKASKLSKIKLIDDNFGEDNDPGFETNLKRDRYEFGSNFEVVDSMDQLIYDKKMNQDMIKQTSLSNNMVEDNLQNHLNEELQEIYKLLEQNKEVIEQESLPTILSVKEDSKKPNEEKEKNMIKQLKQKVKSEREKTRELREDIIKLNEDLLEKFTEIKDEQNGTIEKIVESNIVQFSKDEEVVRQLDNLEKIMNQSRAKASYQKKEIEFSNELLERELMGLEKSLQEKVEHLERTGKKIRKCYALKKKGMVGEREIKQKSEQVFWMKKKYSNYIFNYLKNILVENRKVQDNDSKVNSFANSLNPGQAKKLYMSELYNTNKSNFSDLSGRDFRGSLRNAWGLKDYERVAQELEDEVETLEMEVKRAEKDHWNYTRDHEKLHERVYRMNQMADELKEKKKMFFVKKVKMRQEVDKGKGESKEELIKRLLKICENDFFNNK